LSDALVSVLPERDFVQMPGPVQTKFKLGVAGGLHLIPGGPKVEHLAGVRTGLGNSRERPPLTEVTAAGFNPETSWQNYQMRASILLRSNPGSWFGGTALEPGTKQWRAMQT